MTDDLPFIENNVICNGDSKHSFIQDLCTSSKKRKACFIEESNKNYSCLKVGTLLSYSVSTIKFVIII